MKELKKVRKENNVLKEEAQGFEQIIVDPKAKLEEAKRIEDSLTKQLMENMKEKGNREAEIVSMKNKLQTEDIRKSYENNFNIIEKIINNQKPFFDKTGIGYKQNTDEASSSMTIGNEEKPRSFAKVVKDSPNEEEIECQPKNPIPKEGPAERVGLRRTTPSSVLRYGHFFYGYCFTCGRFRHKL